MNNSILTIGRLARKTGTNVETVRFYEKIGLLPKAERSNSNYRIYDQDHLHRLSFIRHARDLGFSLEHIRELLSLADIQTRPCAAIDQIAMEHRARIEQKIADLQMLKKELDKIIDHCGSGTVADCGIIEALSQEDDGEGLDFKIGA